ncbi:TPA: amidohydrolase family protein [Escherichia coli]
MRKSSCWNNSPQRPEWITLPRHMLTLPHFQFIYALMGAERILFSVDYPYQTLDGVKTFIDSLPVNKAEKEAIAFRNAERLLGITV